MQQQHSVQRSLHHLLRCGRGLRIRRRICCLTGPISLSSPSWVIQLHLVSCWRCGAVVAAAAAHLYDVNLHRLMAGLWLVCCPRDAGLGRCRAAAAAAATVVAPTPSRQHVSQQGAAAAVQQPELSLGQ